MPRYRPLSVWRRVLIALLAVLTATLVVMSLVGEPGGVKRAQRESQARAAASAAMMPVMVLPAGSAPPAASAPR